MKVNIQISLLVALLALISFSATATDVPEAVKKAFMSKYANSKNVEWHMESEGVYEAEFTYNATSMTANFKGDGTWLVTEMEIDESSLPSAVKTAVKSQFSNYILDGAEEVQRPDEPAAFEVGLENKKGDEDLKVLFSAEGKVLKKEIREDEE